ncbi:MAG TPA: hypothetical protein VFR78_21095 [Pyrinomonadaceae bacterium]|nr:hypothetical protein [Pyrinomonadaceae bacterium]
MSKKVSLLIMLAFSVATGGFLALQAQDPQNPSNVRQDPPAVSATTQTDLSGTYTGTFNCEPLGLMGPTTLTITGNEFTTADGRTGRIVASTTGGYTAVALQMGGTGAAGATGATGTTAGAAGTTAATGTTAGAGATGTPMIVSMRGRKSGNRLILTPVSGAAMRCSFTPGRGTARGRRNQQAQPTTPATETEPTTPAVTPTESPMPEQTPSPSPTASPTPSPEPMPSPTPGEPMPSPTPGGSPMPSPSPSPGEPMPSPSPGSSPSPSPSPSPRW